MKGLITRHQVFLKYILPNFLKDLFIYLFMASLGLRCCVRALSSCGEQGLLFLVMRVILMAVASLIAEHRL